MACFWIYHVPNLGNETCFEFEFPSTNLWTQTKGTCLPIALLLFRSHPLFCHSTIEEHVFRRARIGPCNPMKAHVLRPWETSCETIFFHHSFAVLRNQLSIYIWGPISRVQGSKAGSSRRVPGANIDFLGVPVLESTFGGLEDHPQRISRPDCDCFWDSWEVLGTSKNCHSV